MKALLHILQQIKNIKLTCVSALSTGHSLSGKLQKEKELQDLEEAIKNLSCVLLIDEYWHVDNNCVICFSALTEYKLT